VSNRRPVVIDLFAGAGGMSLGFEQAGFDVAAAVEYDPIHAAVHEFNFPECAVMARSVVGLSGREIRRAAGLEGRDVDLVIGGAPCQGFSLIGQRQLDDPRNRLVREYLRIVKELEASYFVFENVKGLTLGPHRRFLEELIEEFEKAGYAVTTRWQVLNASGFGVPQSRERLFLLGARRGHAKVVYPEPLVSEAGEAIDALLPPGPTCGDALGDLPDADLFEGLWESDAVVTDRWGKPSRYAAELRAKRPADWHFGHPREFDPRLLSASMRTEHTAISRSRFRRTRPGEVEPISRFLKLPADGVSNTLRAGTDSARGAFTSPRPIHYQFDRCVTVREMARLHSFPDWFRFHQTKWHGARQIGNSVPPALARAVARAVMTALGCVPSAPTQPIPLGDPALLSLDMKGAARHFGVPDPIGRRNKKSGQRKRTQSEVERDIRRAGRTKTSRF
jgi:DNA (cytosine-5)-methyltransferase 1